MVHCREAYHVTNTLAEQMVQLQTPQILTSVQQATVSVRKIQIEIK